MLEVVAIPKTENNKPVLSCRYCNFFTALKVQRGTKTVSGYAILEEHIENTHRNEHKQMSQLNAFLNNRTEFKQNMHG